MRARVSPLGRHLTKPRFLRVADRRIPRRQTCSTACELLVLCRSPPKRWCKLPLSKGSTAFSRLLSPQVPGLNPGRFNRLKIESIAETVIKVRHVGGTVEDRDLFFAQSELPPHHIDRCSVSVRDDR